MNQQTSLLDSLRRFNEEIQSARRANRELVENLVSAEIARVAGRWGFARRDEVSELRAQVEGLQRRLDGLLAAGAEASTPAADVMNDPTRSEPTP